MKAPVKVNEPVAPIALPDPASVTNGPTALAWECRALAGIVELDPALVRWVDDDEQARLRRVLLAVIEKSATEYGRSCYAETLAMSAFRTLPLARLRQVVALGTGAGEIA